MMRETIAPGIEIEPCDANTSLLFIDGQVKCPFSNDGLWIKAFRRLGKQIAELEAERGQWEPGVLRMRIEELEAENAELTENHLEQMGYAHNLLDKVMASPSGKTVSQRIREIGEYPKRREEEIEQLKTENERLKATCPTPWRTGVPDWDSLDPEAFVHYEPIGPECQPSLSGATRVRNYRRDWNYWSIVRHRIIPHVPPPQPERVYTEADLPKVEGWEWSFGTYTNGRVWLHLIGGDEILIMSQHESFDSQSDAIRDAREWFKKIQATTIPE